MIQQKVSFRLLTALILGYAGAAAAQGQLVILDGDKIEARIDTTVEIGADTVITTSGTTLQRSLTTGASAPVTLNAEASLGETLAVAAAPSPAIEATARSLAAITANATTSSLTAEPDPIAKPDPIAEPDPLQEALVQGKAISFEGVLFENNSATLKPAAKSAVAALARALLARRDLIVRVEGHTDSNGSEAYNLDLSMRRAEAVIAALVAEGVEQSRLRPLAFGESLPVDDNASAAGRARNRRVNVIRDN